MIYLELFLSFVKIGFTSFGGMSMVPLILEEMERHGWMSAEDLTNLIAIAEMTPGSLGVNCATFAGTQAAGMLGGAAAVLGVLSPAFTLTLAAAVFFHRFRDSTAMREILTVVKPICVAMIADVLATLALESFWRESRIDPFALVIFACSFYLLHFRKWSIPKTILTAAAMGLVCYGIL